MNASANIIEIFSGIQGEGTHLGRRHLFIRFAGCNLRCAYCDTPDPRQLLLFAMVEAAPGARRFDRLDNPFAPARLAAIVERLDPDRLHAAVSLTGGEPLLAADFLAEFIPLCAGRRFYLETNGSLTHALEKVIDLVHVVAMDIKLASAAGPAPDLALAREFLALAARREVFVKTVVTARTTDGELADAARVLASVRPDIPLVIQPVTPVSPDIAPPDAEQLLELQAAALRILPDVRVIPQIHRLMGQM